MDNFDIVKKENRLLYQVIRGSELYNLVQYDKDGNRLSDVDYGGVFMCNPNSLIGLGHDYKQEISDSKHDTTWYEIGFYLKLLLKSNPTVMETLFAPKDKIVGDVHPLMMPILENRDEFISKGMFNPLFGYALSQLKKCKSYEKLCNWDKDRITRKEPLDFCYTFYNQGSTKINNWLEYRGLKQKYCGLVNIPNMHDTYGLYYDWGNHFFNENVSIDTIKDDYIAQRGIGMFIVDFYKLKSTSENGIAENLAETFENITKWYNSQTQIGYRGIVGEDGESNELRLSSVSKGENPICHITYNQTGYTKHCVDYKNYQTWVKERNQIRYESNLNKNYDAKNVSHMVRLIHMGLELAKGEGFNVVRTWDRDFILKVKNHGFEFDEIMAYVDEKTKEFNEAIKTSTLKESVDENFVNDLLIEIRKQQLKTIL